MKLYVYQTIKHSIYEQKLTPGQKLIEQQISEALSISRTPIRQAFQQLQEEGFLTISPNKGAQVIDPTSKEIAEAFIYRSHLERMATKDIINWITSNDINKLIKLVHTEQETYRNKDFLGYIETNKNFHFTLIKGCDNRFLKNDCIKIINQTHIYLALYDHFYQVNRQKKDIRGPKEHQMLINFLIRNDYDSFSKLLNKHITSTIEEYTARMKKVHHASDLFQ
ncbi:GntR family transcriptional regulator [Oceanobacillus limi]|nr:GntR family transcriptional regulator [Oceanobacillus limi]